MPLPPSARIIADYLRAKDAQIPLLYPRVFTGDARFTTTFLVTGPFGESPPREGLPAITQAFQELGVHNENIVTVVPVDSVVQRDGILTSQWVVAMTRRGDTGGFAGWGQYRWTLAEDGARAEALDVTFEGIAPLTGADAPAVISLLLDLPHPWCTREALARAAADHPSLHELRAWL